MGEKRAEDLRWPLAGVRVLEIAAEIAGPYCGKLFADAGAEVIKIEPPEGDQLRRWTSSGHALGEGEDGALFQYLNASKRSVVADLETREGCDLVLGLAKRVDLVIDALGPGVLAARGLGFDVLRSGHPTLSLLSISPFGTTGPWAERPATEWTLQAQVGATAARGWPGRGPVGAGGRIGEWVAGTYAAVAGLAAWLSARATGEGQLIDVSMFEVLRRTMTQEGDCSAQLKGGDLPMGAELPGVEPTRDGWVGFAVYTAQQWKDFSSMIGQPQLGEEEELFDAAIRLQEVGRLRELIGAWMRERSVDEVIELSTFFRIAASPIGNGQNLPEMDHMRARGIFVKNPAGFLQPRPPFLGISLRPIGAAPTLGEHTVEARAELATARPSIAASERGSTLPLTGLRVVDLTAFWAGPIATSFLAEMGADVIKVESIQRPDGMRFISGVPKDEVLWEWSPIFHGANSSKRAITLNLDSDEGKALLRRLIETADILIENFSTRVMENFGLTWEAVHEWNPRLIMVRIPAFGLDGPWRDRPGFATNVEQVSGLAWVTGYADMPLTLKGLCDAVGGMHAAWATMNALEERRKSRTGTLVEVPLIEPALNVAAEGVIEYSAYGELLTRSGNRGPYAAPQGVYASRKQDRHVALAVATDAQWHALVVLIGTPAWARDPALASASGRRDAHDAIDEGLSGWFATRDRDDAIELLLAAGVPAAPLINAHRVDPNPQLEHRNYYRVFDHPCVGQIRYGDFPARFSSLPNGLRRSAAPTLGQHNDEVLRDELGLSDDEIAGLRERQIIGERPSLM